MGRLSFYARRRECPEIRPFFPRKSGFGGLLLSAHGKTRSRPFGAEKPENVLSAGQGRILRAAE